MDINDDQAAAIVKAIVMNAVEDYTRSAAILRHRFYPPLRGYGLRARAKHSVELAIIEGRAAERWIRSQEFTGLTGLDGEAVVEGLARRNYITPGHFDEMYTKYREIYMKEG